MNESLIAIRYAKGLAQYAREQGELADVRRQLGRLADLLDPDQGEISVPELLDFLRSPTVPQQDKIRITDVICEKFAIGATVSNFLNVLIRRYRIGLVHLIAAQFERIAGGMESEHPAVVESARPLSETERQELSQALAAATGGRVLLRVKINTALIAGVTARVGDRLFDGSLAGRLQRLQQRLEGGG